MKVIYITSPSFLDYSIEIIHELSLKVDLYVYVVVTPDSLKSTILNLTNITEDFGLYNIDEIGDINQVKLFEPYISNCKIFNIVMFPKRSISLKSLKRSYSLGKIIKSHTPDIVHLDDLLLNNIGMINFLKRYPVLINIHDPKSHSGEKNWRISLTRAIYFPIASCFNLLSKYSINEFISIYKPKVKVIQTYLLPYTSYTKFKEKEIGIPVDFENDTIVLFYGRISKYKGIELLIESFIKVLQVNNAKLIIAGKSNYEIKIPNEFDQYLNRDIFFLNRFISKEEVSFLMKKSKLLVCPYLDATQSGVLMTSIPFKLPVLVSNIGGMPEYVEKYNCGKVFLSGSVDELSKGIIEYLNQKDIFNENSFRTNGENSIDIIFNSYLNLKHK